MDSLISKAILWFKYLSVLKISETLSNQVVQTTNQQYLRIERRKKGFMMVPENKMSKILSGYAWQSMHQFGNSIEND